GVEGLPAEGTVVEQYWALTRSAAARGFEHYEISNYARPGFRSRHNQIYWRAAEYVACGPGACGFVGDVRYGNVKPVTRYCATLASWSPTDCSSSSSAGRGGPEMAPTPPNARAATAKPCRPSIPSACRG